MKYTSERALELISSIPWNSNEMLRVLWIRYSEGSRQKFADELTRSLNGEAIVALILREPLFFSANAILSDLLRLFSENREALDRVKECEASRLSIVILSKDDFRLPQISSPITLPSWFPVHGGRETFFRISDLGFQAEVALLNCPESRIEQTAELVFDLEEVLVLRSRKLAESEPDKFKKFATTLHADNALDCASALSGYIKHIEGVQDRRAYRPNAQPSSSLVSRLLRLTLNSTPKQLGEHAKIFSMAMGESTDSPLKPPLFAVMLRPAAPLDTGPANWHAISLGIFQAYQLMNGAAHAGDYATYPVALLYSNSVDLRRFLQDAKSYLANFDL